MVIHRVDFSVIILTVEKILMDWVFYIRFTVLVMTSTHTDILPVLKKQMQQKESIIKVFLMKRWRRVLQK